MRTKGSRGCYPNAWTTLALPKADLLLPKPPGTARQYKKLQLVTVQISKCIVKQVRLTLYMKKLDILPMKCQHAGPMSRCLNQNHRQCDISFLVGVHLADLSFRKHPAIYLTISHVNSSKQPPK